MVRTLVVRGLIVGLVAGVLAGAFAYAFGEPRIDDAISFEERHAAHAATSDGHGEEAVPFTRGEQKDGLFLATALYGLTIGTLFSLAFGFARGRVGPRSAAPLALALAGALFLAVVLVPFVKYPANPPSVGDPETIGRRTALYLVMLVAGLLALVAAVRAARWRGTGAGVAAFLVTVAAAYALLPGVHEVPHDFPAQLLWDFRVASLGTQLVLWSAVGGLFALLSRRREPA